MPACTAASRVGSASVSAGAQEEEEEEEEKDDDDDTTTTTKTRGEEEDEEEEDGQATPRCSCQRRSSSWKRRGLLAKATCSQCTEQGTSKRVRDFLQGGKQPKNSDPDPFIPQGRHPTFGGHKGTLVPLIP